MKNILKELAYITLLVAMLYAMTLAALDAFEREEENRLKSTENVRAIAAERASNN